MGNHKDSLCGQIFGRLSVLTLSHTHNGHRYWCCKCLCGEYTTTNTSHLRSGHTSSCGCLQKQKQSARAARHRMHGSPEYWCWANMLQRCTNDNSPMYSDYGGRGIGVCKSWHTFEQFYADMGPRPSKYHSIDRKDNDGPYCKDNCRWATQKQQNNNQRKSRLLTYGGNTRTIAQWAELIGIAYAALYGRLRNGWSVADALETPIRGKK